MRVMVLDTETAGFKKPLEPVEVGYVLVSGLGPKFARWEATYDRFFRPVKPIEWGAMGVHHILPDDLQDKGPWIPEVFADENLQGVDYLVGHNIDYDWEVIGEPGIKRICTLALSRYWEPDLDAHNLAAMMYYVFGPVHATRQKLAQAHSASVDCRNTLDLCIKLTDIYGSRDSFHKVVNWHELYAVSEIGRIPYRMTFGKYGPKDGNPGKRIRDMIVEDKKYVSWLRGNCSDNTYLMRALDNPR